MKATAATLIALLAATAHAAAATVSLNNISPDKVLLDKAKQNGGVYVEDVLPEDGKTLSSVVPTNFFMQIMVDPKATITFNSGAAWKQAAQPGRSAFTDYFLPLTWRMSSLDTLTRGRTGFPSQMTERAPYFILSAKADYLEPCGDNQGVRMVCGKKGDKSDPEATCGRK